jgi:hypothetical protein
MTNLECCNQVSLAVYEDGPLVWADVDIARGRRQSEIGDDEGALSGIERFVALVHRFLDLRITVNKSLAGRLFRTLDRWHGRPLMKKYCRTVSALPHPKENLEMRPSTFT